MDEGLRVRILWGGAMEKEKEGGGGGSWRRERETGKSLKFIFATCAVMSSHAPVALRQSGS